MECPVDFIPINENKARLTAFFVLMLAIVYLVTGLWLIMTFLLADFLLRTFNLGRYSLLGALSDAVIKQLRSKINPLTARLNALPQEWGWYLQLLSYQQDFLTSSFWRMCWLLSFAFSPYWNLLQVFVPDVMFMLSVNQS